MATPNFDYYDNVVTPVNTNSFEFTCVNLSDVLNSIIQTKSNAIGPDGVDPKFLKIFVPVLLPHITHIFNTIILKSKYPSQWKQAEIIPLPKSGNIIIYFKNF